MAWHLKTVGRSRSVQTRQVHINSHAYTCIRHRIQFAVGDMTMSRWNPTISLIHPPPPYSVRERLLLLSLLLPEVAILLLLRKRFLLFLPKKTLKHDLTPQGNTYSPISLSKCALLLLPDETLLIFTPWSLWGTLSSRGKMLRYNTYPTLFCLPSYWRLEVWVFCTDGYASHQWFFEQNFWPTSRDGFLRNLQTG